MPTTEIGLVAALVYSLIVIGHAYLAFTEAKLAGVLNWRSGLIIALACLFWPITWVIYGLDILRRGRVA